jgi:hypothetical protein
MCILSEPSNLFCPYTLQTRASFTAASAAELPANLTWHRSHVKASFGPSLTQRSTRLTTSCIKGLLTFQFWLVFRHDNESDRTRKLLCISHGCFFQFGTFKPEVKMPIFGPLPVT